VYLPPDDMKVAAGVDRWNDGGPRPAWEGCVDGDRQDDSPAGKAPLAAPPATGERTPFPWPWGLVALGVMALAWVGVYLIWNGILFVLPK